MAEPSPPRADDARPTLAVTVVPVTAFQQNCAIVFDQASKRAVVVDPGGDLDLIERAIEQLGVRVEAIVLTHGHIDHAGGADELRERLGLPVVGPHQGDKPLLDHLPQAAAQFGLEPARAVTPDRWLDHGDMVDIAGHAFEAVHCPGHSPGSVVLVNRAARFALMGDVLFRGSIGRTDLPGGNHDQLLRSIAERVLPLGDDVAFLPGHGPGSTLGEERASNPFLADLD